MAALRAAGVINPISSAERQRYMLQREQLDWQPITIAGPPLSEDIIEARRIAYPTGILKQADGFRSKPPWGRARHRHTFTLSRSQPS